MEFYAQREARYEAARPAARDRVWWAQTKAAAAAAVSGAGRGAAAAVRAAGATAAGGVNAAGVSAAAGVHAAAFGAAREAGRAAAEVTHEVKRHFSWTSVAAVVFIALPMAVFTLVGSMPANGLDGVRPTASAPVAPLSLAEAAAHAQVGRRSLAL